jgi:hypothetical protein
LHASSVTGGRSLLYIIWWLRDANRCYGLRTILYGSNAFFSDSSLVVNRCPSLMRRIPARAKRLSLTSALSKEIGTSKGAREHTNARENSDERDEDSNVTGSHSILL